jgi:hypothetical protein
MLANPTDKRALYPFKSPQVVADCSAVGRAAVFVVSVCALAASGWAFVQNGGQLHKGGSVALLAGREAVDFELQSAAAQMLQLKATLGTYDHASLPAFHNLVIARSDEVSYCLQVGSGAEARHLSGPGGVPAPGPCS